MFLIPMLTYTQRTSLSVAAERIMPLFHLSQMQLAWMMWAYTVAYTALQIPAGVLGERLGARSTFVLIGAVSLIATIATPLLPMLLSGTALYVAWLCVQVMLGASHAPVSPVGAGVFEGDRPDAAARRRADRRLRMAGRPALDRVADGCPDRPMGLVRTRHAARPAELAELGPLARVAQPALTWKRLSAILASRNVMLLSASYFRLNYALFLLINWSFLYLAQERHMTELEGGTLAAIPPAGAVLGAWLGGAAADRLASRLGARWGYRIVPLVTLPLVGALLLLAMGAATPYSAVAAVTGAFAGVESNEESYWAANMSIARADTMAAGGVLNTGGNLGGVVGIPIVAWLTGHGNWYAAFAVGTLSAIAAALLWLLVDAGAELKSTKG